MHARTAETQEDAEGRWRSRSVRCLPKHCHDARRREQQSGQDNAPACLSFLRARAPHVKCEDLHFCDRESTPEHGAGTPRAPSFLVLRVWPRRPACIPVAISLFGLLLRNACYMTDEAKAPSGWPLTRLPGASIPACGALWARVRGARIAADTWHREKEKTGNKRNTRLLLPLPTLQGAFQRRPVGDARPSSRTAAEPLSAVASVPCSRSSIVRLIGPRAADKEHTSTCVDSLVRTKQQVAEQHAAAVVSRQGCSRPGGIYKKPSWTLDVEAMRWRLQQHPSSLLCIAALHSCQREPIDQT